MTSASAMLPPVLLLGFGKMGSAMAAGWVADGLSQSYAVDPAMPASPGPEMTVVASTADLPEDFRPAAVILAVKPQMAEEALPTIAKYNDAVMLSIMAGKTVAGLRALLGDIAVVRTMPNTPASICQGYTVACAGPGVSDAQRKLCQSLLESVGEVDWVESEELIDVVTAVSGGGPAYVFLLAELLEKAAIEQGIPAGLARRMARDTVSGSGALLAASNEDAAQLRRNVTSPKGTTEQALAVLMEKSAWPDAISRAIAAATLRSRELAG